MSTNTFAKHVQKVAINAKRRKTPQNTVFLKILAKHRKTPAKHPQKHRKTPHTKHIFAIRKETELAKKTLRSREGAHR